MHKIFSAFRSISLGLSEVKLLGQKAAIIFFEAFILINAVSIWP